MNLKQTIADLEEQARKYTEAANNLRALLGNDEAKKGNTAPTKRAYSRAAKPAAPAKKKRTMSEEGRARLSANMKARHAARKAGSGTAA